jgi:hypothetical protein
LIVILLGVLVLTDPLFSFVWVVLLSCLFVTLRLMRSLPQSRRLLPILLASTIVWGTWYLFGFAAAGISGLFTEILNRVFAQFTTTTQYLAPSGVKPIWIVLVEYAAFGSLGLLTAASILLFRHQRRLMSAMTLSVVLTAAIVFLPWLAGFSIAVDLETRSFWIFQLGASIAVGSLLARQLFAKKPATTILAMLFLLLIGLNSLTYGVNAYRYDATAPLSPEDTRLNLESWLFFGSTVCQYTSASAIWGVSIGGIFIDCSPYVQLAPTASKQVAISPSQLPALESILGPDKLVVLRESLESAPEWSQPLPTTVNKILSGYDIVFTAGDPVLIYT